MLGIPHDEYGEEVGAAVALKDGADDAEELRDFVKDQVAAYKYPRRSGSSTICRRDRPARSSSARSSRPRMPEVPSGRARETPADV